MCVSGARDQWGLKGLWANQRMQMKGSCMWKCWGTASGTSDNLFVEKSVKVGHGLRKRRNNMSERKGENPPY